VLIISPHISVIIIIIIIIIIITITITIRSNLRAFAIKEQGNSAYLKINTGLQP